MLRRRFFGGVFFLFCIIPGWCQSLQSTNGISSAAASTEDRKYVSNEVLVRFRPGVSFRAMEHSHSVLSAQVLRRWTLVPGLQLVRIPKGMSVKEAVRRYRQDANLLYAEPNYLLHVFQTPNDPDFSQMWNLHNTGQLGGVPSADIHATQAWNLTTGSMNVAVAVIDTGVDYNHPDLAANIWTAAAPFSAFDINGNPMTCPAGSRGFDAIYGQCDPIDDNGHGTHVTGTIGAIGNNGVGTTGINWQVTVIPCRFLGSDGTGAESGAIECLEVIKTLKDSGIDIIATNNSWGGGSFSQALEDAISAHLSDGILFVAAAGNDFSNNDLLPVYPANYSLPNVISVAATDRTDALASFSNVGQHTVSLGAPGVDILSTTPNNTYSVLSGTSMATPHVTGVAALLAAQNPSLDWRAIKNLLLASGDSDAALSNSITGKRLNAYGAMTCSNHPIYSRLQPALALIAGSVGQPIVLSALNINCSQPAGNVQVTVSPGNQTIPLLDDGSAVDLAAGDGVYSASWTPPALGTYTLTFPGGDVIQVSVLQAYGPALPSTVSYQTFSGTNLNLGDDSVAAVNSPFPINFGGGSFSQIYVSSNGTLSFTNAFDGFANDILPVGTGAFGPLDSDQNILTMVAPFWDDLYPIAGTNQNVFWTVTGSAPNRQLIIEWRNVAAYYCRNDASENIQFEVVFQEGSSNILFNYGNMMFGGFCSYEDNGGAATVGIQVGPNSAFMWSYDQQVIGNGSSILWQSPAPTLTSNPVPTLSSLSPTGIALGSASFMLTLTGTNFVPDSYISFAGNHRAATYVSSTELHAQIDPADFNLYDGSGTVPVSVSNPGPGGGTSASLNFSFNAPSPTITSLSPSSTVAGGFGFVLIVAGSNFLPTAQVQWNGAALQTFVQNPNLLTAVVSDAYLASVGTASVTVANAPGGPVSNSLPFTIASHGNLAASLMLQPGAIPSGVQIGGSGRPMRFLGWNLASTLGPEYLAHFNRPKAGLALSPPKSVDSSLLFGKNGTAALPLPGFDFRNSLPADFIPSGVAAGDFNRDGHIDWVVANGGRNTLWVYLGKGDGTSQLPVIYPLLGQAPVAVAAADLRGIGILDLVVAEADSQTVGVLLGNGDGTFQTEVEYFVPGPPLTLGVADLNKDGHVDVVVGTTGSSNVNGFITLLGDGTGKLGFPISAPADGNNPPFVVQMSLADLNHDGLPDIVYADPNGDSGAWVFINQGDGTFKRSQLLIYGFPIGGVFVTGTAAGDLNGDGCGDVAVLFSAGFAYVYYGDCSGVFQTLNFKTIGLGDNPLNGVIADVNGDGHPDLVTTGVFLSSDGQYGRPAGDLVSVLLNDGQGGLLPPQVYRGDPSMYSFVLADVNGDGKPDVISANEDSDSATIFLNDGKGGYGFPQGGYVGYLTPGTIGGAANAPWSDFVVADLNGDGFPDLATIEVPQSYGAPWQLATLINDGTGKFSVHQSVAVLDFLNTPGGFLFGDFRNTGKPDFLEIGSNYSNASPAIVYAKNNGDGTFAYPTVTTPSAAAGIVAAADFNNDGKLDFVVAGFGLTTFLGKGDGSFTQGQTIAIGSGSNSCGPGLIFTGDFNHDGNMDVLVWCFSNVVGVQDPLYEFLGNGNGTFRTAIQLFPNLNTFTVADVNKDGQPDLIELAVPVDQWGQTSPVVYNIYLGQPDGTFTLTSSYQPYSGSFGSQFLIGASPNNRLSPMVADFNGDGNLDIAAFEQESTNFGQYSNASLQILLGNGDGTFTPSYTTFQLEKPVIPSTAVDVNGDGRADLIELDSEASSFNVIPATTGPSFQSQLVSDPVPGDSGILRLTLALASANSLTIHLSASDSAISIPSTVALPAGQFTEDVPFTIGAGFNINHVFAIQAQSGTEVHTAYGTQASATLPVGFSETALVPTQTVTLPGGTVGGYLLYLTSLAGYATSLTPTCTGLPTGSTCQFGVTAIDLAAGGQMFDGFSVTVPSSIALGSYSFQVQTTDGTFTQSSSASIQVGGFSLSLPVRTTTTLPSASVTFLVNIPSINNYAGPVTLTCSTPISSVTCQTPSSMQYVGGQALLTVQTQNAPVGTYSIMVTGSAGSVNHTVTEQLLVGNVTSSVTPNSATIDAGAQQTFTVALSSENGFNGTFSYSCSNDVGSVACSFNPPSGTLAANGTVNSTLTLQVQSKPNLQSGYGLPGVLPRLGAPKVSMIVLTCLLAMISASRKLHRQARVTILQTILVAATFALGLTLNSCGGGGNSQQQPPPPPPATIHVTVQASSTALTFSIGTITITVP
jgi:hypothetical protein